MIVSHLRLRGTAVARTFGLTLSTALLTFGCHARANIPSVAAQLPTSASAQESAGGASGSLSAPIKTALTDTTVALKSVEVEKTVAGVFGDTAAITAPLIDAVPTAGPTWDIDVRSYEGQERVAFYVNLFTQSSRNRFQEKLRQGTRYDAMIRAKLKAGGIPEDMSYLAMVESGYDPNAYSSAAAVGMWQFMSSTARDVGLRVDWWVDERRDPARSTDAAIRFLSDLQTQFGSLYLAAAAYNGGPGRVSRGLTRFAEDMEGSTGEDRFFALAEQDYLRSETKNYVPQIIAAALVGKEPVRYGFTFDTLPQYVYDSVEVAAGTPLASVATASSVDLATIKDLNPAVLRGMVPPNGALWIRVPLNGTVATADITTALSALPDNERQGYRTAKTAGTETASSIAAKAHITSKQLAWYNPGLKSSKKGKLLAGQSVRIPTQAVVDAALNVPDPSIERYGTSTVAATKSGTVHIVKRGETLSGLSVRYKVSVAKLRSMNGLRGDKLLAGQAIRVRAASATRATPARSATAKRSPVKKAIVKKPIVKNAAVKKTPAKKTVVKKATVKKTPAKKSVVKNAAAKKTPASKPPTKKIASKTAAPKKSGA